MWRSVAVALLLLLVSVRGDVYDEEDIYEFADEDMDDRAFLVIQKKVLEKEAADGTNVTVVLTLFNAGTQDAGRIQIVDAALPKKVEILVNDVDGVPVQKLSPGLSLSYRIVLRPLETGLLVFEPTKVTYAPTIDSTEKQIAYSTKASVVVLTTNEYLVSRILLMGSYVTLGVLKTQAEWNRFGLFVGVFSLILALSYMSRKLSDARRERMRRRAEEFIEKNK